LIWVGAVWSFASKPMFFVPPIHLQVRYR
jgi:hypothetical protein